MYDYIFTLKHFYCVSKQATVGTITPFKWPLWLILNILKHLSSQEGENIINIW